MKRVTEESKFQLIALNKLKPSPDNVRTVPHSKYHIKKLAASIEAHGQLQNLIIQTEREDDKPTGFYLVTVGEGRRLAHLLRVKQRKIKADEPIRCILDDTHNAHAISLAENDIREAMHPADQFEAFKRLVDAGQPIEDVAAQFSVTPLVVKQRLKLANLAPEFIDLYRKKGISLEQLMALAVVDDHEKQKQVWESLPKYDRHPESLRRALTENEIPVSDGIVRFVGLKAYEGAGGLIRHDLFATSKDEGFVMDPDLVRRLATEKLEKAAAQLKGDGCAWVDIVPDLDYSALSTYGHVQCVAREPNKKEQAKLDALQARKAQIDKEIDEAAQNEDEERSQELSDRADDLDTQIEGLREKLMIPDPAQQALAGAVLAITHDGELRIEEGLLKPEDAKRFERGRKAAAKAAAPTGPRLHSAALVRRLTAHRTLALQAVLAQRPEVALAALVHRLILQTFFGEFYYSAHGVQIKAEGTDLDGYAEDLQGCKAQTSLSEMGEALRAALPKDESAVFEWILRQPHEDVVRLLAYCVARTVNGVSADEHSHALDAVLSATGLNMREWWAATAQGYFGSISKARILDAVREEASPEVVATLATMKKGPLAAAAEECLAGTGWLPSFLRPQAS